MENNPGTLLFCHVPKTAGSSLRALAWKFTPTMAVADDGELSLLNPNIDFIKEFRERPSPPPLLWGHFSYGVHRYIGVPPRYACVMREPVARVVSLYRMMRRLGKESPHPEFFMRNGSLSEFVKECLTEHTNNHVARICAGVPPDAGKLIKDRWLLEYALHNLRRHFVLVGRMERLDVFTAELGKLLGWPEIKEIPSENVGPGKPLALDDETRALIEDHNALDVELYNLVKAGALAS